MHLEHILQNSESYTAPDWLIAQANLPDFKSEYARSIADPEQFWGEWAKRFAWFQPWTKVMEWEYPNHRWFVGGQTNITLNALDRHADGPNRTKLAMIWIGEEDRKSVV